MATQTTDITTRKAETLQALLEQNKSQIEAALPKHLTVDRLMRIALTEARKNPVLLECTQASFLGAIIQAAQLGLEPGGALGHCYLVPFKNKNGGREVQFIPGYRGYIDLAYRSPKVEKVIARAVYETDVFEFEYGTSERLVHKPDKNAMGKELTHVYCIVWLENSKVPIFDVMEKKEVEAVHKRSKAESGPWDTDYEAMAKKSVVRRLFKFMPVSIELQNAVGMDESADRGEQFNGDVIETTGTRLSEPTNRANKLNAMLPTNPEEKPLEAEGQPETKPPVQPKTEAKKEEPKEARSRIELGKKINETARDLGVNPAEYCKTMFEKTTKDLTLEEMTQMLGQLQCDLMEVK